MPSLASIRAFEAAARHGSFARAAGELGTSAASVSYHVRQLERAIGVQLFVRHPRHVALTEPGVPVAEEAMRAFAGLRASFTRAGEIDARHLSITALPSFGASWLTPRLGGFRAAYPEIHVALDLSDDAHDLGAGRFDAALRNGHGDWPGLCSHWLFPSLFLPLCAPDWAARAAALDEPDADLPPLLGRRDWWQAWFAAAGRTLPRETVFGTTLVFEHLDIAAAIAGQGIAIGSPILFADDLAAGRLVPAHPRVVDTGRAFWLTFPRTRQHHPKLVALREWIMREAEAARAAAQVYLDRLAD